MRIAIFLLIVSICLVSAKYLPNETKESNALLRIKRSDELDNSSDSVEQTEDSDDDDDDNDDIDSLQKKIKEKEIKRQEKEEKKKRKALEREEKEKRKQEEEQKKTEEKHRKEEEKREKEERKRLEKVEKEKRKQEEKQKKEENKKQEKQRKELEELEKEAVDGQSKDNDFLKTEEDSSVELADIWRNHIYVKYGLTPASTKIEKQAALKKYIQEELGLSQNSTDSERRQAIVRLIQTKLQSNATERDALKNQFLSHINAVSIQKLRRDIEKDLEELNNKTEVLNNVSLPWVPVAKQNIEEQKSFLQTIAQFLSNLLPNWVVGIQNTTNSSDSSSTVSGPASSTSNISLGDNSPDNINIGAGNNAATEVPNVNQSNGNDVSIGSGVSPSIVNENLPTQNSVTAPTDGNSDVLQINGNESVIPIKTGIINSGDSDGASGVIGTSADVLTSDNNILPSEGSNDTNIASTNTVDSAPLASENVITPENSSVASVNSDSEIPNASVLASGPNQSSLGENTNVGTVSTSIGDNVPSTDVDITSIKNGSTSTVGENISPLNEHVNSPSDIGSGSDSALSSVVDGGNSLIAVSSNNVNEPSLDIANNTQPLSSNVVSSDGSDILSTNNVNNPQTSVADNVIIPRPNLTSPAENEGSSNNSTSIASTSVTDNVVVLDVGSSGNSTDRSINVVDVASTSLTDNAPSLSTDIIPSESGYIASINNNNNSTLSISDNIAQPNPSVIASEGVEAVSENSATGTSISSIIDSSDTNQDKISTGGSETVANSSDVGSVYVTETSGSPGIVSNIDTDLVKNSDIATDKILPNDVTGIMTENGKTVNMVNVVSPNINDSDLLEINPGVGNTKSNTNIKTEIVSSQGTSTISPVKNDVADLEVTVAPTEISNMANNDTAVKSSDTVNSSGVAPSTTSVGSTNINTISNGPFDTAISSFDIANNTDTTIVPEIINSDNAKNDVTENSPQTASILTTSPVDPGKGNNISTTISNIISNANTVPTTVIETSPSEPFSQPDKGLAADSVPPAELSTPSDFGNGFYIPQEPGATVVDVSSQPKDGTLNSYLKQLIGYVS